MPKKILLADDSITIQKVVELTFSDGDYEVTAVNNGAKAIQRLGEMRPDIILSDIIMPEKNGYEVCEYVKSHPDYRNIPVVLLTGTFEPFDPDRAEKAGCDAVVTKPFESQSLIHKVEELIAQAASAPAPQPAAFAPEPEPEPIAFTPPPAPEPEPSMSPWMDETAAVEPPSPFTTSGGSFPTPSEAFTHDADIFGTAAPSGPTTEMPFETPAEDAFSGETRAFPKMSFDDFEKMAAPAVPPPPAPPAAPWGEPSPAPFGEEPELSGETRAFEKMSFDDLQQQMATPAPEPEEEPQAEPESPFGAPPPAEEFSGETRAFPRMSLEELQQLSTPEPEPPAVETPAPAAEPSPWDEPVESPMFGGETRAFPKMNFEDLQPMQTPAEPETSPWDEPSAASPFGGEEPAASPFGAPEETPMFGGETRAFPKMSFEDLESMQTPAEPEAPAWAEAEEPAWTPAAEPEAPAMPEDLPFATESAAPAEPIAEEEEEPLAAAPAAAEAFAEPEEPVVPPPVLAPEAPAMPIAARGADLTDEQIDRIARRVVELMSDQVVRNIAWEVIPDLAEMVVKERIRQLESEA